jgi:hypothetical protein
VDGVATPNLFCRFSCMATVNETDGMRLYNYTSMLEIHDFDVVTSQVAFQMRAQV